MVNDLKALLSPELASELVSGLSELVAQEVASKKGLTGMGIKTAFATIKRLKPNIIDRLIELLLPEFIKAISPLYEEFLALKASGDPSDLVDFMSARAQGVASALLSVTDGRATKSTNAALKGVYQKLRPIAEAQVSAAVPALSKLLNVMISKGNASASQGADQQTSDQQGGEHV